MAIVILDENKSAKIKRLKRLSLYLLQVSVDCDVMSA